MNATKKLIKDRISWLTCQVKCSEKHLDEMLESSENLSSHIKADLAEMKELNESLKKL